MRPFREACRVSYEMPACGVRGLRLLVVGWAIGATTLLVANIPRVAIAQTPTHETAELKSDVPANANGESLPLLRAHAHNDYEHPRPLLDALEQGFCSVEADVFLVQGELWVSHDLANLKRDRTLENLYLEPLRQRATANGGHIHRQEAPFTLLIDFKSSADETYAALRPLLKKYGDLFETGAVRAVISGNRPIASVASDDSRLAYIDGRLPDLEHPESANWMPLISDRWSSHFRWSGQGEIPPEELQHLREIVRRAHDQGRRIRFWAIPDNPQAWQVLLSSGVDLNNTDPSPELAAILRQCHTYQTP